MAQRYQQRPQERQGRTWTDRYGRDREYGRFAQEDFRYEQGRFANENADWQSEDDRMNDEGHESDRAFRAYDSSGSENDEYDRIVHGEDRWNERSFQDQPRDEYGRFAREDAFEDRRGREFERGRRSDFGRDRGPNRGRGWFGDSEAHSQAARERWDRSDGPRSNRGRDDFERYEGRGGDELRAAERYSPRDWQRQGEDFNREGGGRGRGWFGDPEGHSQAARSRWDQQSGGDRERDYGRDDRRDGGNRGQGRGGWFGDPEGHAEAARQRWDSQSRGSDRGSRDGGRGQSGRGWFGEPRRHAEAARRGHR